MLLTVFPFFLSPLLPPCPAPPLPPPKLFLKAQPLFLLFIKGVCIKRQQRAQDTPNKLFYALFSILRIRFLKLLADT